MSKKLNNLLQKWPHGGIATSEWLESLGIYKQLRQKYVEGDWLESFGYGAFKRSNDEISWPGALNAIQNQNNIPIHIGAKTAYELRGMAHFIPFRESRLILFSNKPLKLPKWFSSEHLGIKILYHSSSFLRTNAGITEHNIRGFKLKISDPERAILEILFMTPHKQSIQESKYLMENSHGLRPDIVQELLENCTSFKVKRLFLLLAEHESIACLPYLDLKKVKLGTGNRSFIKGGFLHKKYKITIPKDLLLNEGY